MKNNVAELADVGQHRSSVRAGFRDYLRKVRAASSALQRSAEVGGWLSWRCPELWREAAELVGSEGGFVDEGRTMLAALLLAGAMPEEVYTERVRVYDALRVVVLHYRTALARPFKPCTDCYGFRPKSDDFRREAERTAEHRARLLGSRRGRSPGAPECPPAGSQEPAGGPS